MSLIAHVQEQLLEVDELIGRLERSIAEQAEPRPSLRASLRALEKQRRLLQTEFSEAAAQADLDVYRYRVLHDAPPTLSGLTEAWREFQILLNTVYDALQGIVPPKRPRGKTLDRNDAPRQLELGFGYSFPGSVGVALTLPNRKGLFPDDIIERATAEIFELATAYGDHRKVSAVARRLGPAPVQAMHRWAAAHVRYGYGVGIEWQRAGEMDVRRELTLQSEEISALAGELSRTTLETRLKVTGTLTAVDTDLRQFRIRSDDESEIAGDYENAITGDQAARVPARYEASIVKRTRVVVVGAEQEEVTYFLENLASLDA